MTMIFSVVLTCLIPILFFFYYKFVYSPHQVLKRNWIKGPTPSFFYGNHTERLQVGLVKYIEDLHKAYGPVVGYYTGTIPLVSVTDLELIKLVTVKDSGNFINRMRFPNFLRKSVAIKPGLLVSRDEVWRTARQTLSPTFSASKMRAMTPLIVDSVRTLVEIFIGHADSGRSVELFRIYGSFTMETILATAFGRNMNLQKGESDYLTEAASGIFSSTHEMKKTSLDHVVMILSNFPWLTPILQYLAQGSQSQMSFLLFSETAFKLIQERRREKEPGKAIVDVLARSVHVSIVPLSQVLEGSVVGDGCCVKAGKLSIVVGSQQLYKDLLQLMLEASVVDSSGSNATKMDDAEIAGHSVSFMLAGYETTANTLTYVSYLLALHPDSQEKLQAEIDDYYENNPDASPYQASIDLEYLDMVIHESLRLYPPLPRFTRECSKDYCYKDIVIPTGAVVVIPCFLLQKDPDYWKDPEIFDPMRFTAEEKAKRPQQCYMPFGSGPRSCIGMRFALLEAKIALIELMKRFTFVKTKDTEVPLETVLGFTMSPKNGVHLEIVNRE